MVVNRCSRWKDLEASTSGLAPCLGAFVVLVFAASIGTPVEGKIGRYTAEWTLGNQGNPHDRQKPEGCQWSGCSGLEKALVAADGDLGCRAATQLGRGISSEGIELNGGSLLAESLQKASRRSSSHHLPY